MIATIVGKNILLDEKPFTVVGVLPRGFSVFGTSRQFDVWMPMALDRAQLHREDHSVIVFGRLRKGVTLAQAQAEMETIKARLKQQYPGVDQQDGVHVVAFREDLARNLKPGLLLLFGAVVLVLLIACVTSPISSSLAPPPANVKSHCAPRSAQAAAASSASC